MNNDKYFVFKYGFVMHRPPFKVFINSILRKIQFFTDTPFLISSECEFDSSGKWHFVQYSFKRVKQIKNPRIFGVKWNYDLKSILDEGKYLVLYKNRKTGIATWEDEKWDSDYGKIIAWTFVPCGYEELK